MEVNMSTENNDNKIVLIHDADEAIDDGPSMSLKGYGKGVAHYKFWILGITLAVGVAAFAITKFFINPSKQSVSIELQDDILLAEDGKHFVNGDTYAYTDIISKNNIEQTIENNSSLSKYTYSNVKGAFTIALKENTTNQYVLTANVSNFGNAAKAENFVEALLENIQNNATSAIDSVVTTNYLPSSIDEFNKLDFEDALTLFSTQYSYINSKYQGLVQNFSTSTTINSKTLNQYYTDFQNKNFQTIISDANGVISRNKYLNVSNQNEVESKIVSFENLRYAYQDDLNKIKQDISAYESELESLSKFNTTTISTTTQTEGTSDEFNKRVLTVSSTINELKTEKNSLIKKLTNIGYVVTEDTTSITVNDYDPSNTNSYLYKLNNITDDYLKQCSAFKTQISQIYSNLINENSTLTTLAKGVYSKDNNQYTVLSSTTSGGYSSILFGGIGLLVAYALSSFIFAEVYINLDYSKNKEEKPTKENNN